VAIARICHQHAVVSPPVGLCCRRSRQVASRRGSRASCDSTHITHVLLSVSPACSWFESSGNISAISPAIAAHQPHPSRSCRTSLIEKSDTTARHLANNRPPRRTLEHPAVLRMVLASLMYRSRDLRASGRCSRSGSLERCLEAIPGFCQMVVVGHNQTSSEAGVGGGPSRRRSF
jgi:hypothetical protein